MKELLSLSLITLAIAPLWEVTGGEASNLVPASLGAGLEALTTGFSLEYADAVLAALPGVAFDLAAMFDIDRGATVMMPEAVNVTEGGNSDGWATFARRRAI